MQLQNINLKLDYYQIGLKLPVITGSLHMYWLFLLDYRFKNKYSERQESAKAEDEVVVSSKSDQKVKSSPASKCISNKFS